MSALFQGIKQGVARALTITVLVAAIVGLAIYGGVQYHQSNQRDDAMVGYYIETKGLRINDCFGKGYDHRFSFFGNNDEEAFYLDMDYDGNFYECVADHRAASVLASCKFEEGSGGYDVALDVYTAHSQQAVVAQRDVGRLFDNAREALCNAA